MSSSQFTDVDTIRILVATDNHVGYEENDAVRSDDGWMAFDEIMNLARDKDVDMVLLGGDLFHYNQPSRKSLYQVMRSLRKNCLGMKPCQLQFLSDADEVFQSAFGHVNYEDPDINVSIPVFSIHGNHDEPNGVGNFCSLDLLQTAGLINYFGRVPQADNIEAKPVLLQKGQTKLALYGLSNVRDDRMFRTFRDHRVKWFRPNVQSTDWFNLLTVHQNHHAHTATGYLPENMLPEWMDLVVWGHEHECLIDPRHNPETGFHVMQPGSSIATSLIPGEAVAKHVAIVNVTGKDFEIEKHRLKSVRPFVTREITLREDKRFKGLETKKDNRLEITTRLMAVVEEMIEEANAEWESLQEEDIIPEDRPLPLIRLKVESTPPEGGHYDIENPQRFSNRFQEKVANTSDVVYFYKKKKMTRAQKAEGVSEEALAKMAEDDIDVKTLVSEFLAAQSLKILPQGPFGDAVTQFVDKDDKRAMEAFISGSLQEQVTHMLALDDSDEENMDDAMQQLKQKKEQQFAAGALKRLKRREFKPKPDTWDSDLDGHWEDQPEAIQHAQDTIEQAKPTQTKGRGRKAVQAVQNEDEDEEMDDFQEEAPPQKATRGRAAAAKSKPAAKAPAKKAPAKGRGKKAQIFEQDDEEEEADVFMDEDEEDEPPKRATRTSGTRSQSSRAATSAPKRRQTKLNFSQKASQQQPMEISDDEISDDPFESAPATRSRRR